MGPAYASRIATLLGELGISPNYADERRLPLQLECDERALVVITVPRAEREIRLATLAAQAWQKMQSAAELDGIHLLPVSGFRSVDRQVEIIRDKLATGQPLEAILRYVAAPGYSEHHTGRALDVTSPDDPPLEEGFALTPAFVWLGQRASQFGFSLSYPRDNPHGIGYEPWHWCWNPSS